MQHMSSYDQASDRQRFLSQLRQQQFAFQNECNGFFPGTSMIPIGGMGMMMMPMGMQAMMPHPYLQHQQQQRLMMMQQQQQYPQNASGPVGIYSEATAMSRKMIMESASAMEMGTGLGMDCVDTSKLNMLQSNMVQEKEQSKSRNATELSRCVSPSSSLSVSKSDGDDSDSDCESDVGPESMTSIRHAPVKKALMMKAQSETKKCEDDLKRKAGLKRACSEISSPQEEDSNPTPISVESSEPESFSDQSNFIPEIDQPKRRRSAYNLFFQHERARLLILSEKDEDINYHPPSNLSVEDVRGLLENNPYFTDRSKRRHRKSHGKVSFMGLVKTVSNSWKNVDKQTKSAFEELAKEDQIRYRKEWKEYKLKCRKVKREVMQKQKKIDKAQEERAQKRSRSSDILSREESKQEARDKVLKKALSLSSETRVSKQVTVKKSSDSKMTEPQHDEIMHMISSKIAEHDSHGHDEAQLVDLALELDSDFAIGLDAIAMV